mmetsp:Transcript_11967/g.26986  ORF Transcript_11967/g.26986 Transcript_11967/m.26986 type:complete len:692 (+) Transcript_11967:117-2192(+)
MHSRAKRMCVVGGGNALLHKSGFPVLRDLARFGCLLLGNLELDTLSDLSPSNETPVLVDTAGQGDLLSFRRTGGLREGDLGELALDGDDPSTGGRRSDVDHQDLSLGQFLDLGLFATVAGLDTQQPPQQIVGDLDLAKDVGEFPPQTKDLSDQPIGTAEGWIDPGSDSDEAAGNGVLELVVFGGEGRDLAVDGPEDQGGLSVGLVDGSGSDLDLVSDLQNTLEDGSSGDTTLEVAHVLSGTVDVEGPDDDQLRNGGKITDREGDFAYDVLANDVDVVLENRRDGNDGSRIGNGPGNKLANLLLLGQRRIGLDEIDLVLQDQDFLEPHDLDGGKVLRGLRLRAGLVSGHEQEGGVHDRRSVEHGRHQNVVPGAIDEGNVAAQPEIDTGNGIDEFVGVGGSPGGVETTLFALGVSLVDFGVGVTQFDGDVAFQFVFESNGLDTADRLDDRRFSVGHVTDCSDVDRCLARNHIRTQCRQFSGIHRRRVLLFQVITLLLCFTHLDCDMFVVVVVVVVVVARRRRRRGPAISGCFRISGDSLWPGSRFPRWSCHRTRGRRASGPGWRRGSPRRPWWSEGPRTGPGCPTNRSTRERCWRTGHPGPLGGTTGRILRKTAAAVPGLSLRRRRPRAPPGPGFGGRGRGSGACSPSIAAIPRGRPVRGWTNRRCRCFRRRHRGGCRRGSSGRGPGGPPGNR